MFASLTLAIVVIVVAVVALVVVFVVVHMALCLFRLSRGCHVTTRMEYEFFAPTGVATWRVE